MLEIFLSPSNSVKTICTLMGMEGLAFSSLFGLSCDFSCAKSRGDCTQTAASKSRQANFFITFLLEDSNRSEDGDPSRKSLTLFFRHKLDVKLGDLDRGNFQWRQISCVKIRGDQREALSLAPLFGVVHEQDFLVRGNEDFGHGFVGGGGGWVPGRCYLRMREGVSGYGRHAI